MRLDELLSPGCLTNSIELRKQACKAICSAELYLSSEARKELAEFFVDCAKKAIGPQPKPAKAKE